MARYTRRPREFSHVSGSRRHAVRRGAGSRTNRAALGALASFVLTLGLAGAAVPALAGDEDDATQAAQAAEAAGLKQDAEAKQDATPAPDGTTDSPVTAGTESIDESDPEDPAWGTPVEAVGDGAQDSGGGDAATQRESDDSEAEAAGTPVDSTSAADGSEAPPQQNIEPLAAALAALEVGVPDGNPADGQAKLIVRAAGDRAGNDTPENQNVSGLAGVTYDFYRHTGSGASSALTGGTFVGSCTTDATGNCGIFAALTGNSTSNYFHAQATSAPAGWSVPSVWGTSTQYFRFNTGAIRANQSSSNRVVTLPRTYGGGSWAQAPTNVTSPRWANVRDNNTVPQTCGIDVAIVADLSASIGGHLGEYRTAGASLVQGMTGTPSQVALYTFASDAPATGSNNAGVPLTSVATTASAQPVIDAINGLTLATGDAGGTNWDRAFEQVAESGVSYDAVLFLTDGDPTFYRTRIGIGTGTSINEVNEAIHSANAVKATGAAIFAIGIGDGVNSTSSKNRLSLVSGPDDYYTTSFEELAELLEAQSTANCKGTVSVNKQIVDAAGQVIDDSPAGWEFTATTDGQILDDGTGLTDSLTRATEDGTGTVNFPLTFPNYPNSENVTVMEAQQPGYTLYQQGGQNAVCTKDAGQTTVVATNTGSTGFVVEVDPQDVVTCTVQNQLITSQLTLVKEVVNDHGGSAVAADWTLTGSGPAGASISGVTGANEITGATVTGGQWTLSESNGPDGYAASDWVCTNATGDDPSVTGGNVVEVPTGADVTCTITNSDVPAELTLVKEVVNVHGGDAEATDWTLTGDGPGSESISGVTGTPEVTAQRVSAGDWLLSESDGPQGYDGSAWVCVDHEDSTVPVVDGDTVTLGLGDQVTCTVTNSDRPNSVTWAKVAGGSEDRLNGSEWELTGPDGSVTATIEDCVANSAAECPGPDMDPSAGGFELVDLDWGDYTLTETKAPPGYVLDDTVHEFTVDGGHLAVNLGDIVNDQQAGPNLPLTGGLGRDHVYIAGALVLLLSLTTYGATKLQRRRSQRSVS